MHACSHTDFSFIVIRHLRRVGLEFDGLLSDIALLLAEWMLRYEEDIEWSELDELLSLSLSHLRAPPWYLCSAGLISIRDMVFR